MIQEFVNRWEANKAKLAAQYAIKGPDDYSDIVRDVVELISTDDYDEMDPKRIHEINDGDYQGTLVFIIGANGYQPSKYWAVMVGYGSCGGCDTLQSIKDDGDWDSPPNEQQVKDYMMLALHILQGLKEI